MSNPEQVYANISPLKPSLPTTELQRKPSVLTLFMQDLEGHGQLQLRLGLRVMAEIYCACRKSCPTPYSPNKGKYGGF